MPSSSKLCANSNVKVIKENIPDIRSIKEIIWIILYDKKDFGRLSIYLDILKM